MRLTDARDVLIACVPRARASVSISLIRSGSLKSLNFRHTSRTRDVTVQRIKTCLRVVSTGSLEGRIDRNSKLSPLEIVRRHGDELRISKRETRNATQPPIESRETKDRSFILLQSLRTIFDRPSGGRENESRVRRRIRVCEKAARKIGSRSPWEPSYL